MVFNSCILPFSKNARKQIMNVYKIADDRLVSPKDCFFKSKLTEKCRLQSLRREGECVAFCVGSGIGTLL